MFDVEDDVDFDSLDARKFFILSTAYSFIDSVMTHPFFVATTVAELHKSKRPPRGSLWLQSRGNLNFYEAVKVMTNAQVSGRRSAKPILSSSGIVLTAENPALTLEKPLNSLSMGLARARAMYTGFPVAGWGFLFGDVTQMMAYNWFKTRLEQLKANRKSSVFWQNAPTPLLSGFLSMSLCSVPCNITMVLFRQQVFLRTRGLPFTFQYLVSERLPNLEGGAAKSLLRGTIVSSIAAVPSVAVQWQVYEVTKDWVRKVTGSQSVLTSVVSGAMSGIIDAVVTRPVSVITSRMHTDKHPSGFWKTARTLLKQEGPQAFYKGIGSQVLANIPRMGLFFSVYQTFVTWSKKEPEHSR